MRSILLLGLALSLVVAAPARGQHVNGRPLPLNAEAVLLLDSQGKVLFAKNADAEHAPASLVKLMTLYLAFEAIESGRADWEDQTVVSHRVAQTPRYRMGLRAGETVPLRTLLEGVAIASANDAAAAVAEHLAGSEEAFVDRMNAKAQELGLRSTHYANPHGLPDPSQRTTAEDLARLTDRLLRDYPGSRALLGGAMFVYRGRVYSRSIPLFRDPWGVQALKTGFTREAGYNLSVAAWRDGEQFLLIVLGAQTRSLSYRDARTLLAYGFQETGIRFAVETPRRPVLIRRTGDRRSRTAVPHVRPAHPAAG